ncbi:MAG TPA: hypothetical protein VND92_03105 [Vicinamibacterales bacterium]|nr:hypothetical protein [Vicinamibacterales bacterium]
MKASAFSWTIGRAGRVTAGAALVVFMMAPGGARAQAPPPPAAPAAAVRPAPPAGAGPADVAEAQQARFQIFVMEAVLQRAVDHGAEIMTRRIQAVMPNMVVLAGIARARGFRLPDYGVFFDVEVPALRRSVAWSFEMLDRPDPMLASALAELRQHVRSVGDVDMRQSLEEALQQVELQMGPLLPPGSAAPVVAGRSAKGSSAASTVSAATTATTAPVVAAPPAPAVVAASPAANAGPAAAAERASLLQNPESAYFGEVRQSLIEAMLDYGAPLDIGDNEWLTVAARDDEDTTRLTPGDVSDIPSLTLRIRGRDLRAFRTGQISRAEAIRRIEVRRY